VREVVCISCGPSARLPGQLYVTTTGDSAHIAGTAWHYTGGVGDQQLSASEAQQCADFSARIGFPEPSKECAPCHTALLEGDLMLRRGRATLAVPET
jgi:hypothetical protein